MCYNTLVFRGIAQLVEQWSPKPRAEGSSPSAPAIHIHGGYKKRTVISTVLFCYTEYLI